MAGRRQDKQVIKSGIDSSTMVYISMAVVLIVLSLSLYTFGIDLGFVLFGGTPNVNILYGGAALCVVLSYITDVMYIKAIKSYYKHPDSYTSYIPYFNFMSVFNKPSIIISWVLVAVIAVVALPAFTPLGQFMPTNYLILLAGKSIYIILGCMVVFTALRGYHALVFKGSMEKAYKEYISSEYGSGGAISMVSYAIYFLPLIRSISLFTDLNYIRSVQAELDEMYKGEE